MDWDKIKTFHAVAEAGSFTGAAKVLHTSQSALSRQIKTLEDNLNISLFTRHARGLVLTHEGEELFKAADEMSKKINAARMTLMEGSKKPFGPLRITTTITFGSLWLVPKLKKFNELYPDLDIKLALIDDDVDLSTGEADVAIRFGESEHADLIQRYLMSVNHHIYASPKYLKEKGTPKTTSDLKKHNLILYGPNKPKSLKNINWIMDAAKMTPPYKSVLEVNTLFGILAALRAGMGMAAIPDYLAESAPELVRVLEGSAGPAFKAYLVYPSELKRSKRVRAFNDFIISHL